MTNFAFRENHLFKILHHFDGQKGPLDLFLRNYFRANRAVGSKDRRFISEAVYGMMRWKGLLDHLCQNDLTWDARYRHYLKFNSQNHINDLSIPPHIRVSFPKNFFQLLSDAMGEEEALLFCQISNEPAPTTVRINTLKTNREAVLEKWKSLYEISVSRESPWGIIFHKKINFFELSEFKEGFFEVQDEGSQLIANMIDPAPKQKILDYCAGSGGKTLAFAPKLKNSGQIFLHDIRMQALEEAKKRLRRAGIQNAQFLFPDDAPKKRMLEKAMDWILVDAPCSGTGTLRRNPDMKWKFDLQMVERLVQEQRTIFEEALRFLHPKGTIVYATCSVLPQENQKQIAYFQEKLNLKLVGEPFISKPQANGMDGFFGAALKY